MLSADQLKYTACLLAVYPLGFVHRNLPSAKAKHLFSLIVGAAFCIFCFGSQILHSLFTATVTYLICKYAPRRRLAIIVYIFSLGYMSACHIYRMMTDYLGWSLDFTGPQMILTLKLIAFACNYQDGAAPKDGDDKKPSAALRELPGPLEYYSYVYAYFGFLAGPFFEFASYRDFTNKKSIPSSLKPTLFRLAMALISAVFLVLGMTHFSHYYSETPEFKSWSAVHKLLFFYACNVCIRSKYYFGWLLAEGGCVAAGFGHSVDKDGKEKWDGCSNVNPLKVEFAPNVGLLLNSWNSGTQYFLKTYIFTRVRKVLPNPWPVVAVYATSAFWHGFYPGYYFFFFSVFIIDYVARMFSASFRHYVVDLETKQVKNATHKKIYDALTIFATALATTYLSPTFVVLDFTLAMETMASYYFCGHLFIAFLFVVCKVFRPPKRATKKPTPSGEEVKKTN